MKTVSTALSLALLALSLAGLVGCQALTPREEPAAASLRGPVAAHHTPAWAQQRIAPQWWRAYGDSQIDRDVTTALAESADLQQIAARLAGADAQVEKARKASWPRLNLGYGYRVGEAREPDFGPYELKPWTGSAQLQWELDLFDKLQRARESAQLSRRALYWELAGARLMLTSRVVESRLRISRLSAERSILGEAVDANADILKILRDRLDAGLVAETEVLRMEAEYEKLDRAREELYRLQQLAEVELATLMGGLHRDRRGDTAAKRLLTHVPAVPERDFCELIAAHPSLLAAEDRVRAAFRIEEVARLDLLPSFKVNGNLMGASPHFFLANFGVWRRELGPSLDLPIYDPQRLATIPLRRAQTDEAAAHYRSTLATVVGDIDAAYASLASRQRQLASVQREVSALAEARSNVIANFRAGLVSQVEVLEAERSHLAARRTQVILQEAALRDHVAVVRALGGGCVDRSAAPEVELKAARRDAEAQR